MLKSQKPQENTQAVSVERAVLVAEQIGRELFRDARPLMPFYKLVRNSSDNSKGIELNYKKNVSN